MIMTEKDLEEFTHFLRCDEKSQRTITKYLRDCRQFMEFTNHQEIDKEMVLAYKNDIIRHYAPASVNSMLAAINSFLSFEKLYEYRVKQIKVQRQIYCPIEKELSYEEYCRLVETAQRRGNERLSLILQTICATGIRVGELSAVTVNAVRRSRAVVRSKGKTRTVFIPKSLQEKLFAYCQDNEMRSGPVFVSRNGLPLCRNNIWRDMKNLCDDAGVNPEKVYPHNLRHLFARTFYKLDKDPVMLADVLGHSSINTTRIYMVSSGREHSEQLERLKLVL